MWKFRCTWRAMAFLLVGLFSMNSIVQAQFNAAGQGKYIKLTTSYWQSYSGSAVSFTDAQNEGRSNLNNIKMTGTANTKLHNTTDKTPTGANFYMHAITWTKGVAVGGIKSQLGIGICSNATTAGASVMGTSYSAANGSTYDWQRIYVAHSSSQATKYLQPVMYLSHQSAGATMYFDDLVIYTSDNGTTDLAAPKTPEPELTTVASGTPIIWESGVDYGGAEGSTSTTNATGVQNTLIWKRISGSAQDLTLYQQGGYNTVGNKITAAGQINSTEAVWELMAVNAEAVRTYTPTEMGTYAIVHRDLAYNYSEPAYVTVVSGCDAALGSIGSVATVCSAEANVTVNITASAMGASGNTVSYKIGSGTVTTTALAGSGGNYSFTVPMTALSSGANTLIITALYNGDCTTSISSNNTTIITVDAAPTVGTAVASTSTLTAGQGSATISVGSYMGSIQWQMSKDGADWEDIIADATAMSYETGALSRGDYQFRAEVSNGVCSAVQSNVLTITVTAASNPFVTYSPSGNEIQSFEYGPKSQMTDIKYSFGGPGVIGTIIEWTAQEPNGIKKVDVDGFATISQATAGELQAGTYTYIIYPADANGKIEDYSATGTITVSEAKAPAYLSSSPANGAQNVALTTTSFTVTFDDPQATLDDFSKVKMGGVTVTNPDFENGVLTFTAPMALQSCTDYTITVEAGAIKDAVGNTNEEVSIGFRTVEVANAGGVFVVDFNSKPYTWPSGSTASGVNVGGVTILSSKGTINLTTTPPTSGDAGATTGNVTFSGSDGTNGVELPAFQGPATVNVWVSATNTGRKLKIYQKIGNGDYDSPSDISFATTANKIEKLTQTYSGSEMVQFKIVPTGSSQIYWNVEVVYSGAKPIQLTSAEGTNDQTVEAGSAIENIVYTGAEVVPTIVWVGNNKPAGLTVTPNETAKTLTISGAVAAEAIGGEYTYIAKVNECNTLSGKITVTIPCPATLPANVISSNAPQCTTDGVTLTAAAATVGTAYWQTEAEGVLTTDIATAPKVLNAPGTVYLRAYDATTECWGEAQSFEVKATDFKALAVAEAGEDKSGQVNTAIQLAATPANTGTGLWSIKEGSAGDGEFNDATSATATFTPDTEGEYTLVWTVTGDCDEASDEMIVTSAPACTVKDPVGTISIASASCDGGITLTQDGETENDDVWYWQTSATGEDKTFEATDNYVIAADVTLPATIYVRSFNAAGIGCWSEDVIKLEVKTTDRKQLPIITGSNSVHLGGSLTLEGTPAGGTWNLVENSSDATFENGVIDATEASTEGEVKLTYTVDGCISAQKVVAVFEAENCACTNFYAITYQTAQWSDCGTGVKNPVSRTNDAISVAGSVGSGTATALTLPADGVITYTTEKPIKKVYIYGKFENKGDGYFWGYAFGEDTPIASLTGQSSANHVIGFGTTDEDTKVDYPIAEIPAGTTVFKLTNSKGDMSYIRNIIFELCESPTMTEVTATPSVGKVTLTWEAVTDATGYKVVFNGEETTIGALTSHEILGICAGTYDYSVMPIFATATYGADCVPSAFASSVIVESSSTIANAGEDQSEPIGTVFTLAANEPIVGEGVWTIVEAPEGSEAIAPTAHNGTFTPDVVGTYTLRWTITNGNCTSSTDEVQITAIYVPRYDLTVAANPTDAAIMTGSGSYFEDAQVEVGYTLNRGYEFANWVGTVTDGKFTMPAAATMLTANFTAKDIRTITVADKGEGIESVSVSNSDDSYSNYYDGETAVFTATVSEGYSFVGWYDGELMLSAETTYNHLVDGDITLEARALVDLTAPTGLAAQPKNNNSAVISWDAVAGAESYLVSVCAKGGSGTITWQADQVSYVTNGYPLAGVGTYYKATGGGTATFDTNTASCNGSLKDIQMGGSLFLFKADSDITTMTLHGNSGTGSSRTFSKIATSTALNGTYTDLSPAASASGNLSGKRTDNECSSSPMIITFGQTIPAGTYIRVTLSGNAYITSIVMSTAGGTSTCINSEENPTQVVVSGTTATVTGLELDTEYTYSVTAVRGDESAESAEETFTITKVEPAIAPTPLAATNITTSSFTANWETLDGAESYKIQLYENGVKTGDAVSVNAPTTSANFGGLNAINEYTYTITAIGDGFIYESVDGAESAQQAVTLIRNYVSNIDGSFADIDWNLNGEDGPNEVNVKTGFNSVTLTGNIKLDKESFSGKTLIVMPGAKLEATGGSLTVDEVIIYGDQAQYADAYQFGQIKDALNGITAKKVSFARTFIKRSDGSPTGGKQRWYNISIPFNVVEVAALNEDGSRTPMILPANGSAEGSFYMEYYDGAARAASQSSTGNWKDHNMTHTKGDVLINANEGYTFAIDKFFPTTTTASVTVLFSSAENDAIATSIWEPSSKSYEVPENKSSNVIHQGWNYIGNPYSMPYKSGPIGVFYIYNEATQSYETRTNFRTTDKNLYLDPFKPFFVQVEEDNNPVSFGTSNVELRGFNSDPIYSLALNLTNGSNYSDEYYLELRKASTLGYDVNRDAQKIYSTSTSVPLLFATCAGTDLSVTSIPYETGEDIEIPMSYYSPAAGAYTVSYTATDASDNFDKVILRDHEGNEVNLLAGETYPIVSAKNETVKGKLTLIVALKSDNTPTWIPQTGSTAVKVSAVEDKLILRGLDATATVRLFDIAGRRIATYENVDNDQPIHTGLTGVYIVRVDNETQKAKAKVILK